MRKTFQFVYDTDDKSVTIINPDGKEIRSTGVVSFIGNQKPEQSYVICWGDYRSMAESFVSSTNDPAFKPLFAHIKERCGRHEVGAEEILERWEGDMKVVYN